MSITIAFVVGYVVGIIATYILTRINDDKRKIGRLNIDYSDPYEPPYLFLELSNVETVDTIASQDYVILEVATRNYISRS